MTVTNHRSASYDLDSLANAFQALANPHRLAIYQRLLEHERASIPEEHSCLLTDFISKLGVGAPTVSHHIHKLASAGLIEVEKQGKFLACRVNLAMQQRLRRFLGESA